MGGINDERLFHWRRCSKIINPQLSCFCLIFFLPPFEFTSQPLVSTIFLSSFFHIFQSVAKQIHKHLLKVSRACKWLSKKVHMPLRVRFILLYLLIDYISEVRSFNSFYLGFYYFLDIYKITFCSWAFIFLKLFWARSFLFNFFIILLILIFIFIVFLLFILLIFILFIIFWIFLVDRFRNFAFWILFTTFFIFIIFIVWLNKFISFLIFFINWLWIFQIFFIVLFNLFRIFFIWKFCICDLFFIIAFNVFDIWGLCIFSILCDRAFSIIFRFLLLRWLFSYFFMFISLIIFINGYIVMSYTFFLLLLWWLLFFCLHFLWGH